ncbi:MAG: hypothetical protein HRU23_11300 [Gammaproteobacteria bacterium]|nr:hypothetical protein [Gammaproteobacteria bacterium]
MKTILASLLLVLSTMANAAIKVNQSPAPQSSPVQKLQSHDNLDVWLGSIDVNVFQDLDNDGYHQNLTLSFDLDTHYQQLSVAVQLWLEDSDGQRQQIYTSHDFELNGDSSFDSQQINIQFLEQLSSAYYQLQLVVIDSATHTTIFTLDQFSHDQFQDLALEGKYWDQDQLLSIYSAGIELSHDRNGNGYYQHIAVDLDIDMPESSTELVAQFYLNGQRLFTSGAFTVTDINISDQQYFDIDIKQGLAQGVYDLDIHILDAATLTQRHHIKALDWVVFQGLALESASNLGDGTLADGTIVIDVDHSGGSLGWWALGLFSLLIGRKVRV